MPQLITIGETMAAFTPNTPGPLRYGRSVIKGPVEIQ